MSAHVGLMVLSMYMIPVEASGVLTVGDRILVTRSAVNPKLVLVAE